MSEALKLTAVGRDMPPAEMARHLYGEGDRHPVGSAERRAAYAEAAKAQQEADRLEQQRIKRNRRRAA